MKDVTLSIVKIAGSGICVSADDGNRLHDAIKEQIDRDCRVTLSFSGVTRMTTAFLNAAVGQLYGEYSEEEVRRHLAPPTETESWHRNRLKLVVDRAKIFFRNPDAVKSALLKATGLDEED